MIQTYGVGGSTNIVAPLNHHAKAISVSTMALMNGIFCSEFARDERIHRLHMGKGGNSATLYVDGGQPSFAFRGREGNGYRYGRIDVLDKPRKGNVIATITDPKQVPQVIQKMERVL